MDLFFVFSDNADKKQGCQGDCQHTSCNACRFVQEQSTNCVKCRKDDFQLYEEIRKVCKETILFKIYIPVQKEEFSKFQFQSPSSTKRDRLNYASL